MPVVSRNSKNAVSRCCYYYYYYYHDESDYRECHSPSSNQL